MDLSTELEAKIRKSASFLGQIDVHYFCEKTEINQIKLFEKKVLTFRYSHVVIGRESRQEGGAVAAFLFAPHEAGKCRHR